MRYGACIIFFFVSYSTSKKWEKENDLWERQKQKGKVKKREQKEGEKRKTNIDGGGHAGSTIETRAEKRT